jgi:hypothetical protein
MTIHEFPQTREQGLREARIRNLYTALYMCENQEEVRLALEDVHPENLKVMMVIIQKILEEPI